MGEEAFFSFVQRWYTEHMFDTVTTQAFLEALYESCGDDPEVAELVARMFSTPYPSGPSRSSPPPGWGGAAGRLNRTARSKAFSGPPGVSGGPLRLFGKHSLKGMPWPQKNLRRAETQTNL